MVRVGGPTHTDLPGRTHGERIWADRAYLEIGVPSGWQGVRLRDGKRGRIEPRGLGKGDLVQE